jgi:hypothetical protein
MDPQEERKDAKAAMEKAEAAMEKAQARYDNAEEALGKWKQENPGYSRTNEDYKEMKEETDKCYNALKDNKEIYKELVKTYEKLIEKMPAPGTVSQEQFLSALPSQDTHLQRIEQKLDVYSLAIIPFIEELKLEQFALAASSDRSNNQAVKVDCLNYYNNTALTNLPATITCQFLGIDFPTSQVTCSHIFQKKWAKSRAIIELKEINDVQNLLLLFKPIEVAFDEGRICFLWDSSVSKFKMKVLDPAIRTKTVLDLAIRQFPKDSTTNVNSILNSTFEALEGNPLNTGNVLPYKRCLAFHASRSRFEAIHIQKWIQPEAFIVPEDAWSPNILEFPELKSKIELWLNKD